jgi:hypothetical protein
MQEWYHGWWGKPKKITKKQINEMVDNMKKTSIINEKSKQFHKKEEVEAENILQKLYNI